MKRTFKKSLAIILAAATILCCAPLSGIANLDLPDFGSIFAQKAEAATIGTCGDNLTWTFNESTGTLTISGTGDMTDWATSTSMPWHSLRDKISTLIIKSGVTSIGPYSFSFYKNLNNITIPNSVTRLDSDSFIDTGYYNDESNWDNGVLYIGNHLIDSKKNISGYYEIKNGTKTIASSAFAECANLTNILIPDSVISIGEAAFASCSKLKSITIPDGVTNIGYGTFCDCTNLTDVKFGNNVTGIGENAFKNCSGLVSISFPESLTTIGRFAFSACVNLQMLKIPDNVKRIDYGAFINCSGLTDVEIGNGIYDISELAFYKCSNLTNVILSDSVTSIGESAFYGCTALADVYYDGTKTEWSAITVNKGNDSLLNANIHFSETETFTLTYNANGGTGAPSSQLCSTGCDISSTIPSRFGYTFLGWSNSKSASTASYIPGDYISLSSDTVLYAVWEKAESADDIVAKTVKDIYFDFVGQALYYEFTPDKTLTWSIENFDIGDNNSGEGMGIYLYDDRGTLLASAVNHPEYNNIVYELEAGKKYYIKAELTEENSGSINLGMWNVYNLYFDANGGSGAPSTQTGSRTYTIPLTVPTRNGYEFLGWSTNINATSPEYQPGEWIDLNSHTTLYAVWKLNTSGKCGDNLTWNFDEATGTLTISGTGDMYDWPKNWNNIPWWSIKDNIKSVVIKNGVTSIGECAFAECQVLTSVSIPNSVTNIKRGAFAFCKNLKNITIPDSVTEIGSEVFVECISLKSIEIPDDVKTIELSTFSFCTALTSVTIPDSVTKIGNSAFEECSALTDVYYTGSRIGWEAITIEKNNTYLLNANIHFAKDDTYSATFYLDSSAYNLGAKPIAELVFAHGSDMTACFAQAERGIAALKPGKMFVGWKNVDTGEITNNNAMFTEDVEFYAVWTDYNSTVTVWGRNYETGGWKVISTKEGAAGTVFKINTLKSLVTESNYGTSAVQYVAAGSANTYSDETAIKTDFEMTEGNTDVYIFTSTKFDVEFRIPEFDENGYITEDYYSDEFSFNSATDDTFRTTDITAKKPLSVPVGYEFAGWRGTNGTLYNSETITLDYANGTSYVFTAEYKAIEYTIEFAIDNTYALKEIYTVEGTFNIGDIVRLQNAVVTKEDGTKGTLPVIGKENKEQPGGPYKGVNGKKFSGWKVGAQAANRVDYDITMALTLTPETLENIALGSKIQIKGFWEALPYDFVAYYAKSFDAEGKPVYEAMPAVKVKTGENLATYYSAAVETVNANLPEGKRFTIWRTAEGASGVPNNMPAYGAKVYASYTNMPVTVFIAYDRCSGEFAPDPMEVVKEDEQLSKLLSVGDDIENDIPDGETKSVADMVRSMTIPDSLRPEGDYYLSGWKYYHVHSEFDVYYENKWHEGVNDSGTTIAKYPVIFQAVWTTGLSGACGDNLTFVFDKDTGILTISGTGDMWNWQSSTGMPWYKYLNDIKLVEISDGVTSIGDRAFYNAQEIENISIPDSVTSIGEEAFHNCSRIEEIIIPDSVANIGDGAFYGCSSIENIEIPDGVTTLGKHMFYLCTKLKSITIPASVTSIGYSAFGFCNRLYDVYYDGSKKDWNKISIEEENQLLTTATIHFTDCDHNFVPSVTTPATCTEDGVMTYVCECGDSFTEEIPAKGHVPGSWIVSIPASCTVDGETILCCEECGVILGNKNISATGHVPGFWVIVVEPTTQTEGSKIKCCDVCGDLLEEEIIAKLPPKEPVADKNVVKTPSTSTISYGDSIILHIDASKIPEGGYVEWSADNGNFSYKPNEATCTISPQKSGDTVFTATIYDADGNAILKDEQKMTSKAGFFDKIIAFFKGIFGLNKTLPNIFKF